MLSLVPMFLHYGYFVLTHDGQLCAAGDDGGPTADTYKQGSSLGVKNGTEGVGAPVVKGEAAKRHGLDVMVFVDQQPATGIRNPLPRELVDAVVKAISQPPRAPGPATIQTLWKEKNVRAVAIWNTLIFRPPTETFHEFLIEVPLKNTFGEAWYKAEMVKDEADRHSVVRWLSAYREESQKHRPADHQKGQVYAGPATGETTELIALAHDMYMLQKVNRLPDSIINRLRNYGEFQGARYEVAIAAAFVKCGFEIEWIDDVTAKHPEFVGRNTHTREEIAVETKSRRRPGVLHQPGTLPAAEQMRADVDRLYRDALQQDPGNRPFAIFLDVNLPPNTTAGAVAAWQREIVARWQSNEQIALLGFTNFAWHYSGDTPSRPPEFLLSVPINSACALASGDTLECLRLALETCSVCANEY
jgi:hypothetical protein